MCSPTDPDFDADRQSANGPSAWPRRRDDHNVEQRRWISTLFAVTVA
jgi:hypothetical protein